MAQPKKTLYEILGVTRDANSIDMGLAFEKRTEELKRAAPHDPSAEALLHEAYEVLSDERRRAAYDASLVTAAERDAAREQAAAPDLVVEGGDEEQRRNIAWIAIVGGGIAALLIIYFALRPQRLPETQAEQKPAPVVEAPKPAPPPPPKPLAAADVLKLATASAARVVSVEMSGSSKPIGLAVAIEPNMMVTTCHGIEAGRKLVVAMGKESLGAELAMTDEKLDLCKLSVAGLNARPFALAPGEPQKGDKVHVLGANASGEVALTEGTVRQVPSASPGKVMEVSVPIAPAGSGGPVLDAYGRLLGIATTPHTYGAGSNIVLPAAWIAEVRTRGR